jgi:hypothetical protein
MADSNRITWKCDFKIMFSLYFMDLPSTGTFHPSFVVSFLDDFLYNQLITSLHICYFSVIGMIEYLFSTLGLLIENGRKAVEIDVTNDYLSL